MKMAAGNDGGRSPARHRECVRDLEPRVREGVLMHFSWKRWRLALVGALAAIAMSVAFGGKAFAAEPGEWGNWVEEHVGSQYLAARGTMSEARNNGNLLQVWRGETNNIVWLSMNNGNPFQYTSPDGS